MAVLPPPTTTTIQHGQATSVYDGDLEDIFAVQDEITNIIVGTLAGQIEHLELRRVGEPPQFDFEPLDHLALAERHDLIDFEAGAKVTGHKWYFLKNEMAQNHVRHDALEVLDRLPSQAA